MVARPVPSLWLLGLASGLSPFGMAVIVPALAVFARDFNTTEGMAALLVTSYLVGLTIAQPVQGSLCDRFGRRPILITGFALFSIASFICALAPNLWLLLVGRVVQAVGVSVGTVASRAVLRDTRDASGTAEAMTWITAFMGISPVLAPMIGGTLGEQFGWQSIFLFSGALGVVVLCWVLWRLPETRPAYTRSDGGLGLRNWGVLLRDPPFIGFTLMFGAVNGSFFAFLTTGAAIFERDLGLGQQAFGLIYGALSIAYVVGAALAGVMIRRWSVGTTLRVSVLLTVAVGLALPAIVATFGVNLTSLLVPLAVLMACSGIVGPQALAGAVASHPGIAGTAAGVSSSLGLLTAAGFAVVSGFIYRGNTLEIMLLVTLATVLAGIAMLLTGLARPGTDLAEPAGPA